MPAPKLLIVSSLLIVLLTAGSDWVEVAPDTFTRKMNCVIEDMNDQASKSLPAGLTATTEFNANEFNITGMTFSLTQPGSNKSETMSSESCRTEEPTIDASGQEIPGSVFACHLGVRHDRLATYIGNDETGRFTLMITDDPARSWKDKLPSHQMVSGICR